MKIEVSEHGKENPEVVTTENYNPVETFQIINGEKKNAAGNVYSCIMVGENIYSTVSIRSIRVLENQEAQ